MDNKEFAHLIEKLQVANQRKQILKNKLNQLNEYSCNLDKNIEDRLDEQRDMEKLIHELQVQMSKGEQLSTKLKAELESER